MTEWELLKIPPTLELQLRVLRGCHPKVRQVMTVPCSTKTSCCSLHPADLGSNPQKVGEKRSKTWVLLVTAKSKSLKGSENSSGS